MWIFEPIFKTTIWGGSRIAEFKNVGNAPCNVGESWELSAVDGAESIVANGKDKGRSLCELISDYGEELLGRSVVRRFGIKFPLLFKLIDARQALSIQVHPDDDMAARYGKHGKSEMWYVIDAEQGAEICNGFKMPVTADDYDFALKSGTLQEKLLFSKTHAGDAFYIPAGRIHTIGGGVFLAEIQQSSDLTFRVYDYNRKDSYGNLRALHTEEARMALDFNYAEAGPLSYTLKKNERTQLIDSVNFATNIFELDQDYDIDYLHLDSFVVLLCVEGSGSISDGRETMDFAAGSTVLLPASATGVRIKPDGRIKFLETCMP